jgi:hypothetical protein
VENQIREQKKPGDPDEELGADGRGKIATESEEDSDIEENCT